MTEYVVGYENDGELVAVTTPYASFETLAITFADRNRDRLVSEGVDMDNLRIFRVESGEHTPLADWNDEHWMWDYR